VGTRLTGRLFFQQPFLLLQFLNPPGCPTLHPPSFCQCFNKRFFSFPTIQHSLHHKEFPQRIYLQPPKFLAKRKRRSRRLRRSRRFRRSRRSWKNRRPGRQKQRESRATKHAQLPGAGADSRNGRSLSFLSPTSLLSLSSFPFPFPFPFLSSLLFLFPSFLFQQTRGWSCLANIS